MHRDLRNANLKMKRGRKFRGPAHPLRVGAQATLGSGATGSPGETHPSSCQPAPAGASGHHKLY